MVKADKELEREALSGLHHRVADMVQTVAQGRGRNHSKYGWRLLILVCLGALAIGIAGAYLHLTYSWSIGSGPAGPPVSRELFYSAWRPVLFVGLGDSVTAGFGPRKGYSYFEGMEFIAANSGRNITTAKTLTIGITPTWKIPTSAAMMRFADYSSSKWQKLRSGCSN